MIRILIINDNSLKTHIYNNFKNKKGTFDIVATSIMNIESLNIIFNNEFDLIIFNVNNNDSIYLSILKIGFSIKTKIIVLTNSESRIIEIIKNNIRIYQFFLLPIEIKSIISSIEEIYNELQYASQITLIDIENIIDGLQFNFNKSVIGYKYIINYIRICIEKKLKTLPYMNTIYKNIGEEYNIKNISSVKWNIDKCINSMKKLTNNEIINKYFNADYILTPKNFIDFIFNKYKTNKTH